MRERTTVRRHPSTLALILAAGLGLAPGLNGCGDGGGDGATAQQATNRPSPEPAPRTPAPEATPEAAPEAAPEATATKKTPAETTAAATGGVGQIEFASRFHEFGKISDTEKVRATYSFTNTGTGKLVITEVKAGCGCTVPSLEKYEYVPGESGEIAIVFEPKGRKGKSTKYVTVRSNSKVEDVLQLRFGAQIEPLVSLDRFVQLGTVTLGEVHKKTITATYSDPDLEFTEVSINDDHMSGRIIESGAVDDTSSQDRITYRTVIELTVHDDIEWGTLYAKRLQIKVNGRTSPESDPIDYDYSVYVQGNIYGKLESSTASRGRAASPTSTISLSTLDAGKPFEQSLQLIRKDGQAFSVHGATVEESTWDGLQVRFEQVDTNSWNIIIFGDPGDYTGSVRGVVRVSTDVPGEESIPVRFAGRVK